MVPQPQRRDDWPPPVVLKYAGVKSWSAFERGLRVWDLKENDGIFQIVGNTRVSHGWVEDPKQTIMSPSGTSVDHVIDRMVAILQDAAGNNSSVRFPHCRTWSGNPCGGYRWYDFHAELQHGCPGQARA